MNSKLNLIMVFLAIFSANVQAEDSIRTVKTRTVKAYCKFVNFPQPVGQTIEVIERNDDNKIDYVTSPEIFDYLLKKCIRFEKKENDLDLNAIPLDIMVHPTAAREGEKISLHSLKIVVAIGEETKLVTLPDILKEQADTISRNIRRDLAQIKTVTNNDSDEDSDWDMITSKDLEDYQHSWLENLNPKLKLTIAVSGGIVAAAVAWVYVPMLTSLAAEKMAPYIFQAMYGVAPSQLGFFQYITVYLPFKHHLMGQAYIHAHTIGNAAIVGGTAAVHAGYVGSKIATEKALIASKIVFEKAREFWNQQQSTELVEASR